MKKIFAFIILICYTFGVNAQIQTLERLFAIQPANSNAENLYNGNILVQKPALSAQYINLSRTGNMRWSIGTVYNSNTFAIGQSTLLESDFTSPFFSLSPSGNIGIGTSTPISKLDISAYGLSPSSLLYGSGDQINITGLTNSAPGTNIISAGNSTNYRGVFKATRTRGTPSIPTTVEKGDIVMSLLGCAFNGTSAHATAGINTIIDGTVSSSLIPQAITFETGSGLTRTERMRISNEGNIGIGTKSPEYKLDVNGSIRATEIKVVSPDSFPDYVFEKEHYLPKLSEVKQYIAANGHLPGIQSATEARKDGINLVDMQMKLLKKMEEMTLYILEQQERIEFLEKKLEVITNK